MTNCYLANSENFLKAPLRSAAKNYFKGFMWL